MKRIKSIIAIAVIAILGLLYLGYASQVKKAIAPIDVPVAALGGYL